ncbi:hypothetical protein IW262DRAFT_1265064, partial [Armillaria fumosa]
EVDRKVPNFVGGLLPCKDHGDREYYCATMLALFRPWRTGADLKSSHDTTWEVVFDGQPFTECQQQLMMNFNLQYECMDA